MSNLTNISKPSPRLRLIWAENFARRTGRISRNDLREAWRISPAQCSSDLQKLQELSPGCLIYDTSKKCYHWNGPESPVVGRTAETESILKYLVDEPRSD